jgi:hypothetical protein
LIASEFARKCKETKEKGRFSCDFLRGVAILQTPTLQFEGFATAILCYNEIRSVLGIGGRYDRARGSHAAA